MSAETIVYQLLEEIKQVEKSIYLLQRQKQMKEYLVDDLRSLVDRVSEESSFLIPFKPILDGPQLTEKVLISAKGTRKYSEESGFSSLSKCASHTTKANSVYQEDDFCWDYDNGNLVLSKECSKVEGGNGNSNGKSKNKSPKMKGARGAFEAKNILIKQQQNPILRQKNRLCSQNNLSISEEGHLRNVFKFWNEYLPQQGMKSKTNHAL